MNAETIQKISLAVAQERAVDVVLKRIVEGLSEQPGVALARVWLIGPGDICSSCPMRTECPDQTRCLHLSASAGRPAVEGEKDWSRLDGDFRRFPMNVRKIGRIGALGEAVLLRDIQDRGEWIARPDWARREGIRSFAGQPLVFRGEILGVLAVFSHTELGEEEFRWLRSLADNAAVALANSRAFQEIERLREQLEMENAYLREEVRSVMAFGDIVGESSALRKVLEQIHLVAGTGASVLISGESGTGKELVARAIHEHSLRKNGPMIKVNCGSIPRDLFESEFFGHVKGAFTGAVRDRVGRFQLADGGTMFLDEVGEIPLEQQSKLLRVLQEGQFERVGEERTRRVDTRIVAATNRDLKDEVGSGHFRQDLYYRLSVFPIEVPPLRQRPEDIPALMAHFVRLACERSNFPVPRQAPEQVTLLQSYDWPGNVRELQNVVERAVITTRGSRLRFDHVLPRLSAEGAPLRPRTGGGPVVASSGPGARGAPPPEIVQEAVLSESVRRHRDRENIEAALRIARGRIYGPGGAAELLGLKATTLASRIKALGISSYRKFREG